MRFVLILIALSTPAWAEDVDYVRDVKPILARHCVKCHGPNKHESGLRVDSAAGLLQGGDSGPAIVARDPQASRLIVAVTGSDENVVGKMPPEGPALAAAEIVTLRTWIAAGAKAPQETAARPANWNHWAWKAPVRSPLPSVKRADWPRNAVDRFLLARLDREGLAPSPEAERTTLVRRLSLDLLGVTPSVETVDAFLADESPDAYERLVESFLASPAFGERWGRHWLDIARYADSNGYTRDFGREIWRYREWVIGAFNAGMPFDRFTLEQFAGDLLQNASLDQLVATGFHRNTLINEEGGTDQEQFRVDAVADRIATTGAAYLGLTLECARCHQHKYDPISQREYYQLFAFLNQCDEPTIEAPYAWQQPDLVRREEVRREIARLDGELNQRRDEFLARQLAWEKTVTPEQRVRLPGPTQVAYDTPNDTRTDEQKRLVAELYQTTDEAKTAFPVLVELARVRATEPVIPKTMVLRQRPTPRETFVHLRGDFLSPGVRVEPGVPEVLPGLAGVRSSPDVPLSRLEFARWLVSPENPLTPRVVTNRYWQRLFGRGLVETENDFGTQGTPPSHPELLDWLATEFVRLGWDTKSLLRLLVTSAAYRQSSLQRPDLVEKDPGNRLLARQARLRLEAETVRDAALSASGLWTRQLGGPSVHPPQPEGVFQFTQDPKPWPTDLGANRFRRGMYTYFWRSSPFPALMAFDAPDSNTTCTRRVRSNTPLQALTLANDLAYVEFAQGLATRVLDEAADDATRGERAFRLCLARRPTAAERDHLVRLVARQQAAFRADATATAALTSSGVVLGHGDVLSRHTAPTVAAWTSICRVLLNLDEFITRE